MPDRSVEITRLLQQWQTGSPEAFQRLVPLVYDELRAIASRHLSREWRHNHLQTTAVVNEAYLRLFGQREVDWQNRGHFFAVAAQLMRRILVDHARHEQRQKRGGGSLPVALDDAIVAAPAPLDAVETLDLDRALQVSGRPRAQLPRAGIGRKVGMRPGGWRSLVLALFALVVFACSTRLSGQLPLGLMTFNIRTSTIDDGPNGWPHRRELVAGVIEESAPQVVGLQEVVHEQIEYLETRLRDYRWIGVDRGLNGGSGLSEYTPIFYRHAELSVIESGNFWLSPTPDAPSTAEPRLTRIVTWARFHHRASRREFVVFNTHFSPRAGQGQLDAARILRERIQRLPDRAALIVLGDFNAAAEESPVWRELTGDRLRDAWTLADERRGPAATMGGFGPPRDDDMSRIDWILVAGPIKVRSAETVLYNADGRYPSDHYPVAARVEVE